jgi:hypothetical protein
MVGVTKPGIVVRIEPGLSRCRYRLFNGSKRIPDHRGVRKSHTVLFHASFASYRHRFFVREGEVHAFYRVGPKFPL